MELRGKGPSHVKTPKGNTKLIKVLLLKDVVGKGRKGDILENVSPAYFTNYLQRNLVGRRITNEEVYRIGAEREEADMAERERRRKKKVDAMEVRDYFNKLDKREITVRFADTPASKLKGSLFGKITVHDVIDRIIKFDDGSNTNSKVPPCYSSIVSDPSMSICKLVNVDGDKEVKEIKSIGNFAATIVLYKKGVKKFVPLEVEEDSEIEEDDEDITATIGIEVS